MVGDGDGRRIARRRALLCAEAAQVARCLEVLLRRAEIDSSACTELSKLLGGHEQSLLQKAYGTVAPRKRYKGSVSHPLLAERTTDFLFIDESGKSGSEPTNQPPFFTLGAVSMGELQCSNYIDRANRLKLEFFGTTKLTFHEPYLRKHEGPYYFGGDTNRQAEFDQALEKLVYDTDFKSFGVAIRKTAFEQEFSASGIDPYLPTDAYAVSINMLFERYIDDIATRETPSLGRVTFESQGTKEDAQHQLEYARLMLDGTQWVSDSAFRSWLETGLRFTPKSGSDPMELADMFSRTLWEWVVGGCVGSPIRWDLFSDKIYCRGDGMRGTFGVKVFPDSDIRDKIEAHRIEGGASANF